MAEKLMSFEMTIKDESNKVRILQKAGGVPKSRRRCKGLCDPGSFSVSQPIGDLRRCPLPVMGRRQYAFEGCHGRPRMTISAANDRILIGQAFDAGFTGFLFDNAC
jgi:hypothetical protein